MDDPLPSQHFVIDPENPRLAYIGFVRPNVGAIPPMAEMQSMWWALRLEDKLEAVASDLDQACYKLKGSRLPYGVDYGYYMFALAREMGAVPSLLHWLFRSPRIALTCGFGQAHVPIFRLEGPFASAEAKETCAGELYKVLWKRPFFMNLIFVVEAVGFAIINGVTCLLETSLGQAAAMTGLGFWYMTHAGAGGGPLKKMLTHR